MTTPIVSFAAQNAPCTPEDDSSTRVQDVVDRMSRATTFDASTCRRCFSHHHIVHDIHKYGVCREIRPVSLAARSFQPLLSIPSSRCRQPRLVTFSCWRVKFEEVSSIKFRTSCPSKNRQRFWIVDGGGWIKVVSGCICTCLNVVRLHMISERRALSDQHMGAAEYLPSLVPDMLTPYFP